MTPRSDEESLSIERSLGELSGKVDGVLRAQDRFEKTMDTHIAAESVLLTAITTKIDANQIFSTAVDKKTDLNAQEIDNLKRARWRLLTAIAALASAAGAAIKHVLEKWSP